MRSEKPSQSQYARADIGIVWSLHRIDPPAASTKDVLPQARSFEVHEIMSRVIAEPGWILEPRDKMGSGKEDPGYVYGTLMEYWDGVAFAKTELRAGLSFNIHQHVGYGRKWDYGQQRRNIDEHFNYEDFLHMRQQVLLSGYHSVFYEFTGGFDIEIRNNRPVTDYERKYGV